MEKADISEERKIVDGIVGAALSKVEEKYGTGKGDGILPKKYHNRPHSEEVLDAARKIAERFLKEGKISEKDIPLVEIAASFHDIEQDLGAGQNEIESARLAEEAMREAGIFSEEDIVKVRDMILVTIVSFEGGVMRQSAVEEYLTRIIADADLSSLGKSFEQYWERALALLQEIQGTDIPSKEAETAFTERQVGLLTNHRFYTEEAEVLFPNQKENLEESKRRLGLLTQQC